MHARVVPYRLRFKFPAGTSRGVLHEKETYFLILERNGKRGTGECAVFRGLSYDDRPEYEDFLKDLAQKINRGENIRPEDLREWPSVRFGWETALLSLESKRFDILFPSSFTRGEAAIPINGLIWMGDKEFMRRQIDRKIAEGFRVIKMKIGALDFDTELEILAYIRRHYGPEEIELRVDANGAFSPGEALEKLRRLADFHIHSIEQPVKAGQWDAMAEICARSPIPVALDEELIRIHRPEEKRQLVRHIRPAYLILKPSLTGGFSGTDEWIRIAGEENTGYWITSALESNVGLNAIAQYTYTKNPVLPQGLGTGGLFINNFPSPLYLDRDRLRFDPDKTLKFDL